VSKREDIELLVELLVWESTERKTRERQERQERETEREVLRELRFNF
jgi:hypothetical protein